MRRAPSASWLVVIGALVMTVGAELRLERLSARTAQPERELLYLPNGKLLRVASLGFGPLVADAFYIWAIQYYSDYERRDRYRWVEHVFDEVITELDPHYIDAYWLGAMILILEARDVEGGLALLEKGAARNPDEWVLLYLAGWEAYHAGQKDRAQTYFRRAMDIPGAPAVLPRLVAGIEARKGNLREAIELWRGVLANPGSTEAEIAIAERQIRELSVKSDVAMLGEAVATFYRANGRLPRRLEELVVQGLVRHVPLDPRGQPYGFDPVTGAVGSSAGRVLGGS